MRIDKEQGDAVVVVVATMRPPGDDQRVGDMAVEDETLDPAQFEPVARCFGAGRDVVRCVARTFVRCQREETLARRDLRQVRRLLLSCPAANQRGRGEDRGRQQRRQRQVAPHRLLNQPGGDVAEARPAVRLGDQHAGEAGLRHLRPYAAVEAGRVVDVAQAT